MDRVSGRTATAGYLHFCLAETYYAWNQLEEAACSLQQMLRIGRDWQQVDIQLVGYLLLVAVELAAGNPAGAQQALQEAEHLAQHKEFPDHQFWVAMARVRWWLSQGNLVAAGDWAAQVVFDPDAWNPNRKGGFLTLARVYIAQGRYTEALAALERVRAHLDRPGDIATTIGFLALHAVALHGAGKRKQAREVAARLLGLTEPDGSIRVYLDAGEPMRQMLQSLLHTPHDQNTRQAPVSIAYITQLLAAFADFGLPILDFRLEAPAIQNPKSQIQNLIEPLTRREQEVLRLLVAGASNQEIATQLVISLATVKKHVSNLLDKLGVDSRAQAIARARDWSIFA